MAEKEFEEVMKNRNIVTKGYMRDLDALIKNLKEVGETEIAGCSGGYQYTFKKIVEDTKDDLN